MTQAGPPFGPPFRQPSGPPSGQARAPLPRMTPSTARLPKPAPQPQVEARPVSRPVAHPARRTREESELPPIPQKLYYQIGEVATLVGVEPHVLRYWEGEFRSVRPTKSLRGQRVYSRRDVEQLRVIRELLYTKGFTIQGAKKALRAKGLEPHDADDPALVASHRAREALVDIRREVDSFLRDLGG